MTTFFLRGPKNIHSIQSLHLFVLTLFLTERSIFHVSLVLASRLRSIPHALAPDNQLSTQLYSSYSSKIPTPTFKPTLPPFSASTIAMKITSIATFIAFLATCATAFSSGNNNRRAEAAFALGPRTTCKGIELTMYTKTDCSDGGTVACTIPECAQAAATDAPEKWIAFKYNSADGCDPDDLLSVVPETGGDDAFSISALTPGACVPVFTAEPGNYIKDIQLNAAAGCPNGCIKAFGSISPEGSSCQASAKTCSPSTCGNGSGLCIG